LSTEPLLLNLKMNLRLTWRVGKCKFSAMYLGISGQDRSTDIGTDLTRRATRHQGPLSPWSPVGTLLRQVKVFLWKLLRYQHDRMTFQQNAINELVISSVDFQRAASYQAITALEQRIQSLESKLADLSRKANS
jgi:hypothetical protein